MDETPEHEASEHHTSEHDGSDALRAGFATISKEIKDLKLELRQELSTFKDEIKKELREDITYLRQELDRKLMENNNELQAQRVSARRRSAYQMWKSGRRR
ncbi:Integrator complex subunit 4 [Dissostichus eleginoides]|uniref:Integrator complex subunit 4 n=1 Tax=Dissostichus eleginoides TaxID=100907 RepID=A0AAD9F5P2_DISEL|nr:Integrator complex subunit 4 [Dissostichus eleginoides]